MFSIRENGGGGAGVGQGYAPVQQEQGAQRGRWLTTCAVALLVTAGCTGAIEGVGGTGGPGPSGPGQPGPGPGGNGYNPSNPPPGGMVVDPGTGPVVIPPVPAADAPITGNFASAPGISSRFQRLSHRQWENTIADLFKGAAPVNLSRDFLSEPIRSSFNNNGSVLEVSTALWQDYQNAASTARHRGPRDAHPRRVPEQRRQGRQDLHPQLRPQGLPPAADRRRGQPVRRPVRQGHPAGGQGRRLRRRRRAGGRGDAAVAALPVPDRAGDQRGQRAREPVGLRGGVPAVVRHHQLDARRDAVRRRPGQQADPGRGHQPGPPPGGQRARQGHHGRPARADVQAHRLR